MTERGTTAVPISDLAEVADVSRQVIYQQFGDRDTLLLAAALELAQGELLPGLVDAPHPIAERDQTLAMARHFADHRVFYRAMFTGSCAFELNKMLNALLMPVNAQFVRQLYGGRHDPGTIEDLAAFLTGGASAVFNEWVVEGVDPLDPEEFADRLMRLASLILAAMGQSTASAKDEEHER